MAIEDDRFKKLLEGAPFDTTIKEEDLFFERIDNELNKWFGKSEYLDDIDTYLTNQVRNIDSIIESQAPLAAAKFAVLANPTYGNKALTSEEIQKLFSDLKNKDAIKTKRTILIQIAKSVVMFIPKIKTLYWQ